MPHTKMTIYYPKIKVGELANQLTSQTERVFLSVCKYSGGSSKKKQE